ncbi:TPA: hypothetical protein DCX16_05300 [bacterium]|nr:hypothetical protein [bacterium]
MNRLYKSPSINGSVVIEPKKLLVGEGRTLIERLENKIREDEDTLKRLEEEIKEKKKALSNIEDYVKEEAEKKVLSIIKEAEDKANEIIESARKEEEEIKKGGYKEGFEIGKKEGIRKGEIEAGRIISEINGILSSLNHLYSEALKNIDQSIMSSLSCLIAEKIIKNELSIKKDIVLANILEALKKARGQEKVKILINLSDMDVVSSWSDKISGVGIIEIQEDPSITPGGCKILTDFGIIDATIENQLKMIKDEYSKTSSSS